MLHRWKLEHTCFMLLQCQWVSVSSWRILGVLLSLSGFASNVDMGCQLSGLIVGIGTRRYRVSIAEACISGPGLLASELRLGKRLS